MSDNLPPNLPTADDSEEMGLIGLFTAGPEMPAPASVWAAIEHELDKNTPKIDRKADGIWAPTGQGIHTKLLWDGRSLLIQCDAGAIIPEHDHFADERILVLSGDMIVDGMSYSQGDNLWMQNGSAHGPTTTKTGCLILIQYVS